VKGFTTTAVTFVERGRFFSSASSSRSSSRRHSRTDGVLLPADRRNRMVVVMMTTTDDDDDDGAEGRGGEEPVGDDLFGDGDMDAAGVVIDDLNWRVEKLRLEEQNTRRFLKARPRFLPYGECCKWIQAFGRRWESEEEWREWIAMGEKRNSYIPVRADGFFFDFLLDGVACGRPPLIAPASLTFRAFLFLYDDRVDPTNTTGDWDSGSAGSISWESKRKKTVTTNKHGHRRRLCK
jgi:hypothetical protein